MVDFTIDANSFGAYFLSVGQNGTDDTVTVNIGTGFSGTIAVNSLPADGEIDNTIINLPPGWRVQVNRLVEDGSTEDPAFRSGDLEVINDQGVSVGTLAIFSNDIQGIPCFARGTMIDTPRGPVAIEDLAVGDSVSTRDHGAQDIRWIGSRSLSARDLNAAPNLRPIRIRAGALGAGMPAADLLVSPQHRVLVRSSVAQNMFGAPEVLVAAKQLVLLDGIDIAEDLAEVEYFHMLFDRHEVVISNGAATESLFTGPEAMKSLGRAAAEEIFALFPELREGSTPASARELPSGRKARKLAMRHRQHSRPLVMQA